MRSASHTSEGGLNVTLIVKGCCMDCGRYDSALDSVPFFLFECGVDFAASSTVVTLAKNLERKMEAYQ